MPSSPLGVYKPFDIILCFTVVSLTFQATPFGIRDCTIVPLSFPAETKNPNPYPSFVKVIHFCMQIVVHHCEII